MPTLETPVELPKSSSGRKAKPLDEKFLDLLVKALTKTQVINGRPALHGSSDRFPTRGRAQSDGRRYSEAVAEKLDGVEKVSVRVDEYGTNSFGWKLYVPLSAQPAQEPTPEA